MIKCVFALAAKGIVRDAESNNVSIFNVYEQIQPNSFPVLLSNFEFMAVFRRELSDPSRVTHNLKVTINENELYTNKMESDFQGKKGARLKLRLHGLVIPEPGLLTVTLADDNGHQQCSCSIEVLPAPSRAILEDSREVGVTKMPDQVDDGGKVY